MASWIVVSEDIDTRSQLFHGLTTENLARVSDSWPRTPQAPAPVSALLASARRQFVGAAHTYDNFSMSILTGLQATELALKIRAGFDPDHVITFGPLIKSRKASAVLLPKRHEWFQEFALHFRNQLSHPDHPVAFTPGLAEPILRGCHVAVVELYVPPLELAAQAVLAALTSGEAVQLDAGGGATQIRDFDLRLPNGDRWGVEVTAPMESDELSMWKAINAKSWKLPQLTSPWVVSLDWPLRAHRRGAGRPPIKDLHRKAPALLNALSGKGVVDFKFHTLRDVRRGRAPSAPEVLQLRHLGIRSGRVEASLPAGTLLIAGAPGDVGTFGGSDVTDLVESTALAPDNVKKLRDVPTPSTRHLFIWVHSSKRAFLFLEDDEVPPVPSLPAEVDNVWLGRLANSEGGFVRADRLWRFNPLAGWQNLIDYLPPNPLARLPSRR